MSEVNESTGRVQEMKKFVRYADGARMYSMGLTKFQQLAKDANRAYQQQCISGEDERDY